ncbi:hypothetical protein [Treponema pectinovorum]
MINEFRTYFCKAKFYKKNGSFSQTEKIKSIRVNFRLFGFLNILYIFEL